MIEVLSRSLGFVSASLVALIALGFGLMFLFFSGSAALILGHFLRFVRPWRVALLAIGLATLAAAVATRAFGVAQPLVLPATQLVTGLAAWGFVRARRLHRVLSWLAGAVLLGCAGLFVFGLVVPEREELGHASVLFASSLLMLAALGLWPLVLAGLASHRRERPVEWFIS
ncbi:MAG: hypothetical protein ACRDMZ_19380, partial [Solirubrobacteraceae bacterium]